MENNNNFPCRKKGDPITTIQSPPHSLDPNDSSRSILSSVSSLLAFSSSHPSPHLSAKVKMPSSWLTSKPTAHTAYIKTDRRVQFNSPVETSPLRQSARSRRPSPSSAPPVARPEKEYKASRHEKPKSDYTTDRNGYRNECEDRRKRDEKKVQYIARNGCEDRCKREEKKIQYVDRKECEDRYKTEAKKVQHVDRKVCEDRHKKDEKKTQYVYGKECEDTCKREEKKVQYVEGKECEDKCAREEKKVQYARSTTCYKYKTYYIVQVRVIPRHISTGTGRVTRVRRISIVDTTA
ncbi:hypothetical protein EJ05DRAFT_529454 [Pseudovirgaria hyperparasitica]|uniref:Uncharacterized protein n=1 Tax=Pseudovirgaria hyperparasitica TaxID=470096 RepID=A0A6A6W407_9PEZI|nr:uncharacterized protein EJ05DRAFT_529454 [Pseudovirgaria hyperparasitica]KAF2757668.1 hypothetical protein EJ05DRAFT_529454 [Pseudovirgaria hyperparasitica]